MATIESIYADYTARAQAERNAGGSIDIRSEISTIEVKLADGTEYFFQGDAADDLLAEVPSEMVAEDYVLAIAQSW